MRILLWLLFLVGFGILNAQTPEKEYRIYDVKGKKEIKFDELISQLLSADVVFFGEEHNDSIAHLLQFNVFKGLHEKSRRKVILSLEMFQTDVQLVMDEYLAGLISESNFERDARKWNNYADYRPLVEYAKSEGIYVLAANAPTRYTNMVTANGLESLNGLSKQARQLIPPLPIDTLTGEYYEKFVNLMGGHGNMGTMKIYQTQNLWDATMAWKIAEVLKKKQKTHMVLHLNGRFHTDEKLGTFAQLKKYGPKLKAVNISSFAHESLDHPNWAEWEKLGDYVIITKIMN